MQSEGLFTTCGRSMNADYRSEILWQLYTISMYWLRPKNMNLYHETYYSAYEMYIFTIIFSLSSKPLLPSSWIPHTVGKISIEHVTICLGKYITKGAIDIFHHMSLTTHTIHTYKEAKTNKFRN